MGWASRLLGTLVLAVVACDDPNDTLNFIPLAGTHGGVNQMAFANSNQPVILVSSTNTPDLELQMHDGGGWRTARLAIEASDMGYRHSLISLFDGSLVAMTVSSQYRLDNVDGFTWTRLGTPPVPNGEMLGADATGAFYTMTTDSYEQFALRWAPGDTAWAEVPGSRTAAVTKSVALAPDGSLLRITGNRLVSFEIDRIAGGKVERLSRPAHLATDLAEVSQLYFDAAGNAYFTSCAENSSAVYRVATGASSAVLLATIPSEFFCSQFQVVADGTMFLVSGYNCPAPTLQVPSPKCGVILRLMPGDQSFSVIDHNRERKWFVFAPNANTLFQVSVPELVIEKAEF